MAQINVFRMTWTYTGTTTGFVEQLGDELRHMQEDDILNRTTIVDLPDEVLDPRSRFQYARVFSPGIDEAVGEEIEHQRALRNEITVSIPMYWCRQEIEPDEGEYWQLRFNGSVVASVRNDLSGTDTPWEAYYIDHEDCEIYLGNYESLKGGMEALHEDFGRDD